MYFPLFIAATLMAAGCMIFGHFELHTPLWRRLSKLIAFLGITAIIANLAGTAAALVWIFVMFGIGLGFHTWWTRKHGIGFLSAEPRAKYYALRGWLQQEQV